MTGIKMISQRIADPGQNDPPLQSGSAAWKPSKKASKRLNLLKGKKPKKG